MPSHCPARSVRVERTGDRRDAVRRPRHSPWRSKRPEGRRRRSARATDLSPRIRRSRLSSLRRRQAPSPRNRPRISSSATRAGSPSHARDALRRSRDRRKLPAEPPSSPPPDPPRGAGPWARAPRRRRVGRRALGCERSRRRARRRSPRPARRPVLARCVPSRIPRPCGIRARLERVRLALGRGRGRGGVREGEASTSRSPHAYPRRNEFRLPLG